MSNISKNGVTIVRIHNAHKYQYAKSYGVLQHVLDNTVIINWDGTIGGMTTNVAHGDYSIVPTNRWEVIGGEVHIVDPEGYYDTGLRVE